MNDIIEFLNSHGSVRKFTDTPITETQELEIVTTAQRSPTSSNVQAYSIISVRHEQTKFRLAELTGGQQHVAECSLFFVFCADLYRLGRINKRKGYHFTGEYTEMFVIATVDAALAACRALMAAQALGFGGVMVGGIRNEPDEVARLLDLPELVYPVMGMSLGEPVKPPKVKPRLPVSAIHFKEKYDPSQIDSAIEEYDRIIAELGYLQGREVEPEKYPSFDDLYSWSEHTARRMANTKRGTLRPHMLEFLQKRGLLKR